MDIVHLIETKIIKSTQDETSSHTYAEIEQTITLDHSEGWQAVFHTVSLANALPISPLRLHSALRQVSLPFMKTLTAPEQAGALRLHVAVQARATRCPWCQPRTCPPVWHRFTRHQDDQRQTPQ